MSNTPSPLRARVLPVIDLKRGQVVRGVAGQREKYGPIESGLVRSPNPVTVAKALCEQVGVRDIYLADLDALAGQEPDWNCYHAIGKLDYSIWLDAGTGTVEAVERVLRRARSVARVIIALESLESLRSLETIVSTVGAERLVFSLDLKDEMPVTSDPAAQRMSPETIAAVAIDAGIRSILVLDVASVGVEHGPMTVDLCRNIRCRYLHVDVISGGGVRDMGHVQRFVDAGCERVLVSSALHAGLI